MKWQVPKPEDREKIWREKHKNWTRGFAWRPILDYETRTRYWLCFIWMRGEAGFDYYRCYDPWWAGKVPRCPGEGTPWIKRRNNLKTFGKWEIRGGSFHAPDVKDCPPNQKPTVVR